MEKNNDMVENFTKISQKMENKLLQNEKLGFFIFKRSVLSYKFLLLYKGKYKKIFSAELIFEKFSPSKQKI